MITRRGLLGAVLGAAAAPAFVNAKSLMPIWTPSLILYGDGLHDDIHALERWFAGDKVLDPKGRVIGETIENMQFTTSREILLEGRHRHLKNICLSYVAPVVNAVVVKGTLDCTLSNLQFNMNKYEHLFYVPAPKDRVSQRVSARSGAVISGVFQ